MCVHEISGIHKVSIKLVEFSADSIVLYLYFLNKATALYSDLVFKTFAISIMYSKMFIHC